MIGMSIMDRVAEGYPNDPGFKERGTVRPSTSQVAAAGMVAPAKFIRGKIIDWMRRIGKLYPTYTWTPDEMAHALGMSIMNVRPRFTELDHKGLIERTGERRPSVSGKPQNVYKLKPE